VLILVNNGDLPEQKLDLPPALTKDGKQANVMIRGGSPSEIDQLIPIQRHSKSVQPDDSAIYVLRSHTRSFDDNMIIEQEV
jgi:hypothetical protein